jgi:chromosome partitioning protein
MPQARDMIITLSGAKGGTGKSTLAVHLGAEWAARGKRVLVVDADPQGTAITWGEVRAASGRDKPTVIPTGDNVRQAVADIAPGFDVVLIDTAGRQSKRLVGALSISELALMPCQPSGPDIWALQGSLDTVREVQELRPDLRAAIVVNGENRTKLSASARQALDAMGVPVIGSLNRRTAIGEATTAGEGITERDARGAAAIEVRAVLDAIETFMVGGRTADVA